MKVKPNEDTCIIKTYGFAQAMDHYGSNMFVASMRIFDSVQISMLFVCINQSTCFDQSINPHAAAAAAASSSSSSSFLVGEIRNLPSGI